MSTSTDARRTDIRQHPSTDSGNAERFTQQLGRDVRFCHPWGKRLAWDGTRWAIDHVGQVERLAKLTARAILNEAAVVRELEREGL